MAATLPDPTTASNALLTLSEELWRSALHAPRNPQSGADLLKTVLALHRCADRCLNLAIATARQTGAGWKLLEQTTGVPDATLSDRLARWEASHG